MVIQAELASLLTERLVRYARIHTTSDSKSTTVPSTQRQWDLLYLLKEELEQLGLDDISLDKNGYLFASLPASTADIDIPVLGLLAHVDTAPDYSGENVKPQIIRQYDGKDIVLQGSGDILSPKQYPALLQLVGHDLMTSDGTTLLGADDKAGIAIILTAVEYLLQHPELKHGKIRLGFTPDEEIGRGPKHFDVKAFAADVAYTIDGSELGELQYENFNAAEARVDCYGFSIHPGMAKDKMINAFERVCAFHAALPEHLRPETSDGYNGFIFLREISGDLEHATLYYALRDFTKEGLEKKKQQIKQTFAAQKAKYQDKYGEYTITDKYANMAEKIAEHPYLIELAKAAMADVGVRPNCEPIRGGTDGAQLSFMGLPTPNLFTGGANFHGKYEYISLNVMNQSANVVLNLIQRFTKYHI